MIFMSEIKVGNNPLTMAHNETLNNDHLEHHGIIGMKWGVRRFQPYPKGYKGDGKFVDKKKKAKRPRTILDASRSVEQGIESAKQQMNNNILITQAHLHDFNQQQLAPMNFGGTNQKKQGKEAKRKQKEMDALTKHIDPETKKRLEGGEFEVEVKTMGDKKYVHYEKKTQSPSGKKYDIGVDSDDIDSKLDFSKYDDFEKNSDKILKDCENAAYDGISDWLKDWAPGKSKAEVIENLNRDTPYVRITPNGDTAEVVYYSPDIDHFPSVEYDFKTKKARPISVDG